ncbi:MAG: hypothetical protein HKL85_09855, partial [Acidimicrobiaceae bacterium]|nr:hypothetical protein [Acidimicrobiaceae bacterium]
MKIMFIDPKGHRKFRSVLGSAVTLGAVSALLATGLTFVASSSASAATTVSSSRQASSTGYGATYSTTNTLHSGVVPVATTSATTGGGLRSPLVTLVAQATLTLTSISGTVGTALTLTASGGSGSGAVTYGVTNTGTAACSINGVALNATRSGTCTVTVTKAADATYLAASSPATTVTFVPATLKVQAAFVLTSTSGFLGTPLTLTASGGSGSGAVTYGVTNTGTAACWISSNKLNATRSGTCTVTVTKAADATYLATSSPATTVTFGPAILKIQAVLTLTSRSGTLGTPLTLTASGGSGSGAVTY